MKSIRIIALLMSFSVLAQVTEIVDYENIGTEECLWKGETTRVKFVFKNASNRELESVTIGAAPGPLDGDAEFKASLYFIKDINAGTIKKTEYGDFFNTSVWETNSFENDVLTHKKDYWFKAHDRTETFSFNFSKQELVWKQVASDWSKSCVYKQL